MIQGFDILHLFGLLGSAVFALSGALEAGRKKMDVFGAIVVALVTALGGGTLRDLLLPGKSVFWVTDSQPVITAIVVAVLTFYTIRPLGPVSRRMLLIADAAGLAFFTVLGVEKSLSCGLSPLISVMMGTITGIVGGIVRDILCNTIPLVLQREVYATASLAGGIMYLCLGITPLSPLWRTILAIQTVFLIRLLALRLNLALPRPPEGRE